MNILNLGKREATSHTNIILYNKYKKTVLEYQHYII